LVGFICLYGSSLVSYEDLKLDLTLQIVP